jgi:hypothetical protein
MRAAEPVSAGPAENCLANTQQLSFVKFVRRSSLLDYGEKSDGTDSVEFSAVLRWRVARGAVVPTEGACRGQPGLQPRLRPAALGVPVRACRRARRDAERQERWIQVRRLRRPRWIGPSFVAASQGARRRGSRCNAGRAERTQRYTAGWSWAGCPEGGQRSPAGWSCAGCPEGGQRSPAGWSWAGRPEGGQRSPAVGSCAGRPEGRQWPPGAGTGAWRAERGQRPACPPPRRGSADGRQRPHCTRPHDQRAGSRQRSRGAGPHARNTDTAGPHGRNTDTERPRTGVAAAEATEPGLGTSVKLGHGAGADLAASRERHR